MYQNFKGEKKTYGANGSSFMAMWVFIKVAWMKRSFISNFCTCWGSIFGFTLFLPYINDLPDHWVKSVHIWSYFWSVFSCTPEITPYLDTFHAVDVIWNIIIYAYDNNVYSKCNQASHLRIKWRLIFALVIRSSRLQLWVGYLHLHSFNGYF